MGIPINIDDYPPDAIAESSNFEDYDDVTAEDCGFDEDDVPIGAYEDTEETLIADNTTTPDSPTTTVEESLSDLLCTVIPAGGHVYGFVFVSPGKYTVLRYLDNDETDDTKRWTHSGEVEVRGNTSIEIAFRSKLKEGWETVGLKSNLDNTLIVIGALPKGVYNHEL